jgi:putative transcriptional regulator
MPKPKNRPFQSLKGQLLLDGGGLQGSYFNRTVVLLCEHNPEGALGLVLNRPSENRLEDVLSTELPPKLREETLFGGGPVQPAALSYLHSDPGLLNGNVMENLSIGHDLDELVSIGESWSPSLHLRVFAGYAGWAPGQLDDEMRRNAWLTHPADIDLVFHLPPEDLWKFILRKRPKWEERLLADAPDDISFN